MNHGIIHSRSQALVDFAYEFADNAHRGIVRDYTGEPYITHPVAVARLVASVTDDCETICAALLHDVIEDCGVTHRELCEAGFRWGIADMVVGMSDVSKPEDGNRAVRKAIDRAALAKQCPRVKTIKLADLIHNSESILRYGKGFAKVYIGEMTLLLEVLKEGDQTLWKIANIIVITYRGEKLWAARN